MSWATQPHLGYGPLSRLIPALRAQLTLENLALVRTDIIYYLNETFGVLLSRTRTVLNQRHANDRDLPPELLRMIFLYILQDVPETVIQPHAVWNESLRSSRTLLTLSWVCRRWRSILLSYPAVWTVINDHHPDAFHVFLQRSQGLPIAVKLDARYRIGPNPPRPLMALPYIGPRLRELHWASLPYAGQLRKAEHLTFPAPQLRILMLVTDGSEPNGNNAWQRPTLFANHTPALRMLCLGSIRWLPANHFSSLTHICLSRLLRPIKFQDTIRFLSHCQRLQHLVLNCIGTSASDDPVLSVPRDEDQPLLPQLHELVLSLMPPPSMNDYTRFLVPRDKSDFVLRAVEIPPPIGEAEPVDIISLLPRVAQSMTHLLLTRETWYSEVMINAKGPYSGICMCGVPLTPDDEDWNPDDQANWAMRQLDKFPLDQIDVFVIGYFNYPSRALPFPEARAVAERIERMKQLLVLVISTNELGRVLVTLFTEGYIPTLDGDSLPCLREVQIIVRPDDHKSGDRPEPADSFTAEHLVSPTSIEKLVILSPVPSERYPTTLATLRTFCRSVEYEVTHVPTYVDFPGSIDDETVASADHHRRLKL